MYKTMKKRTVLTTLVLSLFTLGAYNQNVGINADGSIPESGTMLDVKSAGITSGTFGLKVKDSGGTDHFVVRSDGKVGIGTAAPTEKLSVFGASSPAMTLQEGTGNRFLFVSTGNLLGINVGNTADNNRLLSIGGFGNTGIGDMSPDGRLEVSAEGGTRDLLLLSSDDENDGDRFIVKNSGNVGIGTNVPETKLHVKDGTLSVSHDSNSPKIQWKDDTDGNWFHVEQHRGLERLYFESITTNFILSLKQNGSVGIGVANPQTKLQVEGGNVYVNNAGGGMILKSPNGTCYRVTVSDVGVLTPVQITCP